MKINIVKNDVKSLDINDLKQISLNPNDWQDAGISEYRLYAYLSNIFNNKVILDIGTRTGGSALALSHNIKNKVISYDLVEQGASSIKRENIEWKIQNFMEDETIPWNKVSIIMIDVDPHDGSQEREMMSWLREKNWKGILIHDDIGPDWPDIQTMWNEINDEKYDLTDIGHISGTGIVNFGNVHKISII